MKEYAVSDSELLLQYSQGNEEAFEELVERHKNRVFTTILLVVKDRYLAEDLTQETFIKAIKTLRSGGYNETGKFLPWLLRIAHNLAIDHHRKTKRRPTMTMSDGSDVFNAMTFSEDSFEKVIMNKELHLHLKECIKQLPDPQKKVLIMRHYMKMSFQEIAEATGVSINTALGRMRYAILNLRKMLQKDQIAYDRKFYPK